MKTTVLGIRVTDSERKLIEEKFGRALKQFIISHASDPNLIMPSIQQIDTGKSETLSDIDSKLDKVLDMLGNLSPKKVSKKIVNEDFLISNEDFIKNTYEYFKAEFPSNLTIAAEQSRLFTDYWLENTKTGIPLYKTKPTWKLSSRVSRWATTYRNNPKNNSAQTHIQPSRPKVGQNRFIEPRTSPNPTPISQLLK